MANGSKKTQTPKNNAKKAGQAAYERLSGHQEIHVFASNVGSIGLAKAGQRVHSYNQDLMKALTSGNFPSSRKDAFDKEVKEMLENVEKSLNNLRKLTRNGNRSNRPTASTTKKKVAKKKQQGKQQKIKKAASDAKSAAA